MEKKIDQIEKKHFSSQYKLTPHRKIILEAIIGNSDRHLSAEDIYGLLRKKGIEIGLATIYRTLELFVELNILHKVNFDDGRSRYELTCHERHRHHHLVCLSCGEVAEVEDDLLNKLEEIIERNHGFKITDHTVKFYGYCRRCRPK
ncbi:MAG TPA: transcriptional repressor [Syntrophomonadaceae bacterium]|nr:transcriptional repressor [Syntrophomonadaceae bacterium]